MQEDLNISSEPITIIQEPIIDLGKERKFCSKFAMNYFIYSLIVMGCQILISNLIMNFFPQILSNFSLYLIINMAPIYVIGFPILIMLGSKQETVRVEKQKLSFGQFIGYLAVSYGVMVIGNIIGLLITYLIGVIKGSPVQNSILNVMGAGDLWGNILIVGLCAPIFEELVFRKLLMDRILRFGEGIAVVISGLMFGLFHGNFNQFFYAFFLGMVFAYIYSKTGKIKYCIFLHMIINMGSTLLMPLFEKLDVNTIQIAQNNFMASGDAAQYLEQMMPFAIPLIIVFFYVLIMYGMGIAGIILLIVKRKKISFHKGVVELPRGKKFSTLILNIGMILYIIIWMFMFISSVML